MTTDRRTFLTSSVLGAAAVSFGPGFWTAAYAGESVAGPGPYGPLGEPDDNGIRLPEGFTSRRLATTGAVVPGSTYVWHASPDGGATFPQPDGGWVYTSNSEVPGRDPVLGLAAGGAGALRFDAAGEVTDAYSILQNTAQNCAGGPTPWGTWLSCEEDGNGQVYECDVTGGSAGLVKPALGTFAHEAVAVDPVRGRLYLTEDRPDGRFYRFTPDSYSADGVGTLDAGLLEALVLGTGGAVTWKPVTNPQEPQSSNRDPEHAPFNGGEGVWFDSDHVYFTTKGDNRVWDLDVPAQTLSVVYDVADFAAPDDAPLQGVDNITVSRAGDLIVAEDGGTMDIVLITPEAQDGTRVAAKLLTIEGQDASEICGPSFSPDGTRLYFSSQRGVNGQGITYEVSGPFRGAVAEPEPVVPEVPATALLAGGAVAASAAGVALSRRREAAQAGDA